MPLKFNPGTNCPEYPFEELFAYQHLELLVSMYMASKSGVMSLVEGGEEDIFDQIREHLLLMPALTGRENLLSERLVAAQ